MTVVQSILRAFRAVQKIFGKRPPIQSADDRSVVNTRLTDEIHCVRVFKPIK